MAASRKHLDFVNPSSMTASQWRLTHLGDLIKVLWHEGEGYCCVLFKFERI